MPLHLLSKKSWNVYNPAAIARVRADEAEAAAQEEKHEQQLQDYEAKKRLAVLRGEDPPPLPPSLDRSIAEGSRTHHEGSEKRSRDDTYYERRKRRKLAGEDDTDRDIRVAKEQEDERREKRDRLPQVTPGTDRWQDVDGNAPIVDMNGHIQLFAPLSTGQITAKKEASARSNNLKEKESANNDDGSLRFSNAAGFRNNPGNAPWYAARVDARREAAGYTGTEEIAHEIGDGTSGIPETQTGKNAFGNDDPSRYKRDAARLSAADPLAAMKKAQTRLKQTEKEREKLKRERDIELAELKEMQRKERRRDSRDRQKSKRREDNEDDISDFSLDHRQAGEHPSSSHRHRSSRSDRPRVEKRRHRHHSRHHDHSHSHRNRN